MGSTAGSEHPGKPPEDSDTPPYCVVRCDAKQKTDHQSSTFHLHQAHLACHLQDHVVHARAYRWPDASCGPVVGPLVVGCHTEARDFGGVLHPVKW